jgi:hypothetical protein
MKRKNTKNTVNRDKNSTVPKTILLAVMALVLWPFTKVLSIISLAAAFIIYLVNRFGDPPRRREKERTEK